MERQYLDQIIDRTVKRIASLDQKLLAVRPGEQMPVEDQVTIGSGRQMEVAILFLDICGYSSWFNDSYDAQKLVLAIMNILMAEMMNIVRDHKGEFEKNTGDGLMAYFGCESDQATDCIQSAIKAGLTMHYFNDHILTPYLTQNGFGGVRFRIGIDYGKVTIGRVGIPGGMNSFVAIGTTANIACKLLNVAEPGEIIIGQNVKDHLPVLWHQFCNFLPRTTGFSYVINNSPYWAYKYTGRWKTPQLTR